MKKRYIFPMVILIQAVLAQSAYAIDWRVFVNVVNVETTYMPSSVVLSANVSGMADGWAISPNCSRFEWTGGGNAESVKANLGVILTAMATGKRLRLYGSQAQSGKPCLIEYIYMENN